MEKVLLSWKCNPFHESGQRQQCHRCDSIPMPFALFLSAPALRLWFALVPLFRSLWALFLCSVVLTPLPRPLGPPFCPPVPASPSFSSFFCTPLPRCLRLIRALSTSGSSAFALLSSDELSSPLSSSSSSDGTGEPPRTRGIVNGLQMEISLSSHHHQLISWMLFQKHYFWHYVTKAN